MIGAIVRRYQPGEGDTEVENHTAQERGRGGRFASAGGEKAADLGLAL